MKTLIALCLSFALFGCSLFGPKKPALPAGSANVLGGVDAATVAAEAERSKVDAARKEAERQLEARDSRIKAAAGAARDANQGNPEGAPKVVVDGETGRIQAELDSVAVAAIDAAAAKARVAEAEALVQAGHADEARKNYADSQAEAKKSSEELGAARKAVADADARALAAEAKVAEAVSGAKASIESNRKANQAALDERDRQIQDLKDGIGRQTQFWLTMGCYGLAVLCVIAAGLLTYFGLQSGPIGIAGTAKRAGLPAFFAVIFFGLGRFTSQPWFWWAVGTTTAVTFIALITVFFLDARKTRAVVAQKAEAQGVGDDIITAVHDIRQALQNPPVEIVKRIQEAKDLDDATRVVRESVGKLIDDKLGEYVTEGDGTAAYVDQRRRSLGLVA